MMLTKPQASGHTAPMHRLLLSLLLLPLLVGCYPQVPASISDDDATQTGPSLTFDFGSKGWSLDNTPSSYWLGSDWVGTFPVTSGDAWGTLRITISGVTLPWSGGTLTEGFSSGFLPNAELTLDLAESYITQDPGFLNCAVWRSVTVNSTGASDSSPLSGAFSGGLAGQTTGTCQDIQNGFFHVTY